MAPDKLFSVPEPPTGIGTGFLSEYWRYDKPLPRCGRIGMLFYYLGRGIQSVKALPGSNTLTVATLAISLFLLAGLLLILVNIGAVISEIGSELMVTVYFKGDVEESKIERFVDSLQSNPRVRSLRFVSKQKALEDFRAHLGTRSSFLSGLEDENPLPASLDLVVQPDDLGLNSVERMVETLRREDIVDEVVYGSEWVNQVQKVLRTFRVFASIVLVVALLAVVFLMANTIKLVIYSRCEEIIITKLVGASDRFIKIPFMLGGLLQGLAGAILGLVLLRAAFMLIDFQLHNSTVFGVALPALRFLDSVAVALVIGVGVIVGAMGSLFALGRFLDV